MDKKKSDKTKIILFVIAFIIGVILLDFLMVAGIYALICFCFGMTFSWRIALGIWILLIVFQGFFQNMIRHK